ncbi:MAG: hypothetical protein ABIH92_02900, partial [Nanoarchaeota archaeon]
EGRNPVKMGLGRKAFYQIVGEMKKTKTFDYSVKWSSEYNPEWATSARKNKRKGIKSAVLTRVGDDNKKDIKKWLRVQKNMKKFDNDGVAMSIRDEEIMISLIKSNTTLLISDKPFIKIMKKFFEDSYEKAEAIK